MNEADPNIFCDQCGKPQWYDGSDLCSWRACAETGSCDGRQHRRGATMPTEVTTEALTAYLALAEKATAGPWEREARQDHENRSAWMELRGPDNKVICDTLNSDAAVIHEDVDGDDGTVHRWDETGYVNFDFIAASRTVGPAAARLALDAEYALGVSRDRAKHMKAERDEAVALLRESVCKLHPGFPYFAQRVRAFLEGK